MEWCRLLKNEAWWALPGSFVPASLILYLSEMEVCSRSSRSSNSKVGSRARGRVGRASVSSSIRALPSLGCLRPRRASGSVAVVEGRCRWCHNRTNYEVPRAQEARQARHQQGPSLGSPRQAAHHLLVGDVGHSRKWLSCGFLADFVTQFLRPTQSPGLQKLLYILTMIFHIKTRVAVIRLFWFTAGCNVLLKYLTAPGYAKVVVLH